MSPNATALWSRRPHLALALAALLIAAPLGSSIAQDDREPSGSEQREFQERRETVDRDDDLRDQDRAESRDRSEPPQRAEAGAEFESTRDDERDDVIEDSADRSDSDDEVDRAGDTARALNAVERDPSSRIDIERGTDGRERRRGELLLIAATRDLHALRAAGYTVLSQAALPRLDFLLVRLRVSPAESVETAQQRLLALLPSAAVAPNHIYRPSQARVVRAAATTAATSPVRQSGLVGVIDSGADPRWPPLAGAIRATRGFGGGPYTPRAHGTRVAEIAAAQGAMLVMADVFGVDQTGQLVAPADAIASALAWLLEQQVPVINISIEGPDNPVLERVVARALTAGVALVAAAGNGGPSAAPAYPAAYPGVIAVTAVDQRGKVYRRANRGSYIAFAAHGVQVASSYPAGRAPQVVSGTSFAAPVVAAEIAARLAASPHPLPEVMASLQAEVVDLGPAGRDMVYGWGQILPAR